MATIAKYVRGGGSYLGFCAGAYFASSRVEWEMGTVLEVQGDRPLKFFPGPSHGCVYPGFQYLSENGARSISIVLPTGTRRHGLYYNGGGHFVMSENLTGVTPLAHYDDAERPGMIAGVGCNVDKGKVVLWHVHLEFPTNSDLAIAAAVRSSNVLSSEDLAKSEFDRQALLRESLQFLGLNISPNIGIDTPQPPSKPLPQLLCGSQVQVAAIAKALHQLREEKSNLIEDANDTFQLHEAAADDALPELKMDPESPQTRHIVAFSTSLPSASLTPHFSVQSYFADLETAQKKYPNTPSPPLQTSVGNVLLYGEAVTSTQTLLQRQVNLASFILSDLNPLQQPKDPRCTPFSSPLPRNIPTKRTWPRKQRLGISTWLPPVVSTSSPASPISKQQARVHSIPRWPRCGQGMSRRNRCIICRWSRCGAQVAQ